MNATTIPLDEVIPWSPHNARTILICDSVETDGRFVLHTMASQVLSSSSKTKTQNYNNNNGAGVGRVFWLTGSPITPNQVATALKKIGCDMAATYLREKSNEQNKSINLTIRSLATEIASQALSTNDDDDDDDEKEFNDQSYLKKVYKEIKTWVQQSQKEQGSETTMTSCPSWVILDDVSAMAMLLGETNVYCLIDSLNALSLRHRSNGEDPPSPCFGLLIRCSHDWDQMYLHKFTGDNEEEESISMEGWFGAGGTKARQMRQQQQQNWIPWERSLLQIVDVVIDVVPLTSGYSREAHGRLIFSECPGGQGWRDNHPTTSGITSAPSTSSTWNKLVMNYCLHDNGVKAIRLRTNVATS